MSNLRLVNQFDVTTPANKILVTDDYDVYCIQFFNTTAGTQRENNSFDMRLINDYGVENTNSNYDNKMIMFRGVSDTHIEVGGQDRDDFAIYYHDTVGQNGNANCTMWLFNPFASDKFTYMVQQTSAHMSYTGTNAKPSITKGIGCLKEQLSITGYAFTNRDSYTISTGTFKTYGLRIDT